MKTILLASASILAFAGAASAESSIVFGGDAELGFRDSEAGRANGADPTGFFYSANLNVTFAADLGNGLTTNVTFAIPVADNAFGDNAQLNQANDFVLAIAAEGMGGIYFGDTNVATQPHWDPGFAMASDGFTEQDNETVIRGNGKFAGFDIDISGIARDGGNDDPTQGTGSGRYVDQIAFGMSGTVGLFTIDAGYQQESVLQGESFGVDANGNALGDDQDADIDGIYDSSNGDFNPNEIAAIAAGATFGGADVKFGFSRNFNNPNVDGGTGTNSYGVLVRYPVGPVSLAASYTFEPDYDINRSYKVAADYVSGPISLSAYYQDEVGDREYGVEAVYSQSELTTYYIGYIKDVDDGVVLDGGVDDGFYVAARQGLGDNFYVEGSYAEFDDAGPNEVDEGAVLKVGLTF